MVISNEIEVATLRLFEYIAISIEFYNVSRTMTVKEPAKKCAACSEGLFCLFSPYYCSLMDVSPSRTPYRLGSEDGWNFRLPIFPLSLRLR